MLRVEWQCEVSKESCLGFQESAAWYCYLSVFFASMVSWSRALHGELGKVVGMFDVGLVVEQVCHAYSSAHVKHNITDSTSPTVSEERVLISVILSVVRCRGNRVMHLLGFVHLIIISTHCACLDQCQ